MQFGVFTHYFFHPAAGTAARIRRLGFTCVQLNTEFADWRFDEATSAAECQRIRRLFEEQGLSIAALAGYRNIMATDPARRAANLRHIRLLLARAPELGSSIVATEAGSLHPQADWRPCPENDSAQAMARLIDVAGELAEAAARAGSVIAIEPSVGTVLDTPAKTAQLARAIASPHLGLVADWANFLDGGNLDRAAAVLREMRGIAQRFCLAHLKDARRLDGGARERHHHASDPALYGNVEYPAAGEGDLDLAAYLSLLTETGYQGAVILEHLDEAAMPKALRAAHRAKEMAAALGTPG